MHINRFGVAAVIMSLLCLTVTRPTWGYDDQLVDLGQPISSVVIAAGAYGPGVDGEPLMYVVVKGPPALFNVIDMRTGERVFEQALPSTKMSWGMDVAPDGAVYIATSTQGKMYRWRPGATQVDDLGRMLPGETHLWELEVADDGLVYSGTYSGGRAFEYNPETKEVRDFGKLAESASYARGITVSDTHLYVGTGAQVGQLFQIDRQTGEVEEIPLPQGVDATMVGNLQYESGLLFTSVQADGQYLVYNVNSKQWEHHRLSLPSPPGPDGKLYSLRGHLFSFDPQQGEWESTGYRPARGSARGYGWLDFNDPELPGLTLVSADMRGAYWLYNPQSEVHREGVGDAQASPVPIRSTYAGPDGRIYIGGYLSPEHATAYDPELGKMIELPRISQIEGWGTHQGDILIGVYPGASIYRYDLDKPWDRSAGNPEQSFHIGDQQDRPFAFASTGQLIAIGTVPKAGQLGGALTIYDPKSGDRTTHRNIVENQSIISLAYHEATGLIVGGSSISCGLGVETVTEEGTLFLWDLEQEKIVWSGVPVPGQMGVTGLTVDEEGMVWGVTGQHLFRFDPQSREILRTTNLFPEEQLSDPNTEWVNGYLNFHDDGMLYGMARSRVFRFDPETWESQKLLQNAAYFAQDPMGNIYVRRATNRLVQLPYSALE